MLLVNGVSREVQRARASWNRQPPLTSITASGRELSLRAGVRGCGAADREPVGQTRWTAAVGTGQEFAEVLRRRSGGPGWGVDTREAGESATISTDRLARGVGGFFAMTLDTFVLMFTARHVDGTVSGLLHPADSRSRDTECPATTHLGGGHRAGAASVSASENRSVVLVFVDQTITVAGGTPSNTASTAKVTLDKIGDQWLVSGFDPV